MTITYNRGLLLAGVEGTFNVAETLNGTDHAIEVINPDYVPDISSARREVVTTDLSRFSSLTTRKFGTMTFAVELKGNGLTGDAIAPRIGNLLRACGFERTRIDTAVECVYRTVANADNSGDLNFYGSTTAYEGLIYLKLRVEIVSGGGSGSAVAAITAPAEANETNAGGVAAIAMENTDEVILTDGTEISLHDADGNPIVSITPDFQSNNPATGDVYWVYVRPRGNLYRPVSDNMDSVTLEMFFPDESGTAIKHQLTGARGTFTINAQVGEIPTIEFEFTGSYVDVVDAAMPTPTYETSIPVGVEYAALAIAVQEGAKQTNLCAGQWSLEMGNEVNIRDCINAKESAKGAIITNREPAIAFDPEARLEADSTIWNYLEQDTLLEWWVRHGTQNGNTVLIHAPKAQLVNIEYADRNSIRTWNIDANLSRLSGNDEVEILFT